MPQRPSLSLASHCAVLGEALGGVEGLQRLRRDIGREPRPHFLAKIPLRPGICQIHNCVR